MGAVSSSRPLDSRLTMLDGLEPGEWLAMTELCIKRLSTGGSSRVLNQLYIGPIAARVIRHEYCSQIRSSIGEHFLQNGTDARSRHWHTVGHEATGVRDLESDRIVNVCKLV
jgi:hypothetical protein